MKGVAWLRNPERRGKVAAFLLLGLAVVWSVFRIYRSMHLLFGVSNDLYTYYSIWTVMGYRDLADIALRQSLYLPHTWLVLTPLFIFGWVVARILMLLINIASVAYICWRLAQLTGLEGIKNWLLPAFFCGWVGTGLVIGLGNLALVCVAAMLAAYPFDSARRQGFLALSAMKQSLVFPVYLQLLLKRPKTLILPFAVFGVCGVAALVWARLSPLAAIKMAGGAVASVGGWTQYDHLCLRRVVAPFISSPGAVSAVSWGIWFALFAMVMRMKEPVCQLAAMMVLSLLPLYHNLYDMVAAAPALAVFLKRSRLIWPALMTVLLATNVLAPLVRYAHGPLHPIMAALEFAYYPLILLLSVGALIWVDRRDPKPSVEVQSASLSDLRPVS